jgi:hypothetical protein
MQLNEIHRERKEEVDQNHMQQSVESEMREMSLSWGRLERLAQNRDAWRALVGCRCTRKGAERH